MKGKVIFLVLGIIMIFIVGCKKDNMSSDDQDMMKDEAETVTLTGYIMDVNCGTSGKGLDGSDVVNSPQDHSKHCLDLCKASGYGIMTRDAGGEGYKFIKFDEDGSNLGTEIIKNSKKEKGIEIEVKGALMDDMLTVADIYEK